MSTSHVMMEQAMKHDKTTDEGGRFQAVASPPVRTGPASKRPYRRPELTCLGDLRSVTLGGSPGTLDSGAGFNIERPPTP